MTEITLPNAKQEDERNEILLQIAKNLGGFEITKSTDIREFVAKGRAKYVFDIGGQIECERETSIAVTMGQHQGITSVTLSNEELLNNHFHSKHGIHCITYDGHIWHNELGEAVELADWSIQVGGTPQKDDEIVVNIIGKVLKWDIIDFDKHTLVNKTLEHSMALCMHDIFQYGIQVSAPQMLYWSEGGMSAGTYYIKLKNAQFDGSALYDGVYKFTITKAIPANGGFRHNNLNWKQSYSANDPIGNHLITYDASGKSLESGIAVAKATDSEIASATILATFTARSRNVEGVDYTHCNYTCRNAYGSNRYSTSSIRQWLNSDAPKVASGSSAISNWWKKVSKFDLPPSYASSAGFLHGLEPEFIKSLKEVEIVCGLHDCDRFDGQVSEIVRDKVFLLSRTEVFGSNEICAEGVQLEHFKGMTNEERIKYEGATPRIWWLRSANSWNPYYVHYVYSSGTLNGNLAYNGYGVVPACVIA